MKKILATIALALTFLTASAQWTEKYIPADELTGTKEGLRYFYYNKRVGLFHMAVPYPCQFMIASLNHPFQTDYVEGHDQSEVTVGLYTNNELVEKFTITMTTPRGYPKCLRVEDDATEEDKKKADKLISHLYHAGNSVRIVAPLYGSGNFDLRIPNKSTK